MISWIGTDKRGVSRTGLGMFDPAEFVESCFKNGWLRLTMKASETGTVVGTIRTDDSGLRIWWAES
jgi:hypothetical protein